MNNNVYFLIPMPQLVCAIILVAGCLFLGRYKIGLLIGYFFCLYWGYISNMHVLIGVFGGNTLGVLLFVVMGLALGFFGLFMFFAPKH